TDYRIVAGMRGDAFKGVSYDTYYQYSRVLRQDSQLNYFDNTKIAKAIDVVTDPATGLPVCRSVLDGSDPSCVPYNIFQTGGVTQAALNYLQVPLLSRGNVNEIVADANFTIEGGEYGIQTPWSDRGVGLNVGVEYRKESLDFL